MLMPTDPERVDYAPRERLVRALVGAPEPCRWGQHLFDAYPAASTVPWPPGGGIYIFTGREQVGLAAMLAGRSPKCVPLYVGETEDFSTRLTPTHEKWPGALGYGATHIHVCSMLDASKTERLDVERELRGQFQPVMNPLPRHLPSSFPPWAR